MSEDRRDEDHWRIDKRINLSILGAAFMFVAGVILWGANVESKLVLIAETRTNDQEKAEMQIKLINAQMNAAAQRTEQHVITINKNIDEIKSSVEKLSGKIEELN